MADQVERVIFEAADNTASGAASANRNIDSVEKHAMASGKKVSTALGEGAAGVAKVTEVSAKKIESFVQSVERRVLALRSPLERLDSQRAGALSKVGGDPAQIARVTKAFDELIAAENKHNTAASKIADAIRNPLQAAGNAIESIANKYGTLGIVAVAGGAAIGAGAVQVFHMVEASAKAAETISNLADQLGLSSGEVQILSRQAEIASVDIETLVGTTRKLADTLTDGGSASQAAVARLESLGITVVQAGGGFRSTVDIIRDFSGQLSKFPDHASKVKALSDVFGRSAVSLLPLIEHFAELEDKAKAVGPVLDDNVIKRLADADDKMDQLGLSWQRLRLSLSEKAIAVIEFTQGKSNGLDQLLANGAVNGLSALGRIFGVKAPASVGNDGIDPGRIAAPPPIDQALQRGTALVDRFRSRSTLEGLNRELALLQTRQNEVGATIQSGLTETAARSAITQFDQISGRIERLKGQIKSANELPAKVEQAHQVLVSAMAEEQTGLGKLFVERQKALDQYGVTKQAIADINDAFARRIVLEEKGLDTAQRNRVAEESARQVQASEARARVVSDEILRTGQIRRQTLDQERENDLASIDVTRDARLRALDAVSAQTLQQQSALDQARVGIEADYQARQLDLRTAALDRETDVEISKIQILYDRKLVSENVYQDQRAALEASAEARVAALRLASEAQVAAAREDAQTRANQRIEAQYRSTFESFKHQAEGVFDSLTKKGEGVFAALGNAIKTVGLTAVKDLVTNRAAGFLTELTTGQKVSFTQDSPQAGPLGRLAGLLGLGSKPVFGNKLDAPGHLGDVSLVGGAVPVVFAGGLPGAGGGLFATPPFAGGGSGGLGGVLGRILTPGGGFTGATPPFLPAGTATAAGASQGGAGGAGGFGGIFGGLKSSLSTLKDNLSSLGNLGSRTISAAGTQVKSVPGVGGVAGGALLAGGGILAADGLRRGGLAGLGETAAGGALIGAKFGGPIGALIGGAIGAAAGTVRLFVKGKADKIVERVRSLYGISISKSFATDPIQKLIDSQFGGDVDFGLRQPAVMSLLRSWAGQSGQNFALENRPYAVGLSLQGGAFTQTATTVEGKTVAYGGGSAPISGPVDNLITGSTPGANGAPATLVVQSLQLVVNGQGATAALTGQIARSPGPVASAQISAIKGSNNRRELQAALLEPGLVTM